MFGKFYFEEKWPREGLSIECFAHELMNFNYHWHRDRYELSILLQGRQEYCRGNQIYYLEEGDMILTGPMTGHSSFSSLPDSQALVIHFSANAFKNYLKKGTSFDFPACVSNAADRNDRRYRKIRSLAAQIYLAEASGSPYRALMVKGGIEMLLASILEYFEPVVIPYQEENERQKEVARALLTYLEEHFREKVTLQDLADYTGYNRTYISTLFKDNIGINFNKYLNRIRFQQALQELALTDKTLTSIAIDNGFSDLKTLNTYFRETLHRTPAEYRIQLDSQNIRAVRAHAKGGSVRRYLSSGDEALLLKLENYL